MGETAGRRRHTHHPSPPPPHTHPISWIDVSATAHALSDATTFAIAASSWKSVCPRSMLPASMYPTASVAYTRPAMSASAAFTAPNSASFLPNWVRPATCAVTPSSSAFWVPASIAHMPNRPLFKISIATRNPPPGGPSAFSSGTFTSLKYTSDVGEHRMPIFFSGLPWVSPPNARSTMNAPSPSLGGPPAGSGVDTRANTVNTAAVGPLEIQIFDPLRM